MPIVSSIELFANGVTVPKLVVVRVGLDALVVGGARVPGFTTMTGVSYIYPHLRITG